MSVYLNEITSLLCKIEETQSEALSEAADRVCETIRGGGIIYVFGCGHSHLPGLDCFYRAGGLANVSPMLDTDLMLHNGGAKSSRMEKMSGIGSEIFRRYCVTKNDMLVVISLSGKNAVPLEVTRAGKNAGVYTVGISSSEYFSHGGKLQDTVDLHIDCLVPYGDACVDAAGAKMGGLSTAASCFILNSVLINGADKAYAAGADVPVYKSGNIEGGKEHNVLLEERYLGRVKHL